MDNKMIKNAIWKDILKLHSLRVIELIHNNIFFYLNNTNMSEEEIYIRFQVLNNNEATDENDIRQRVALYEMETNKPYYK